MSTVGYAFAPPAFYDFCKRERRLCNSTGSAKVAQLTPARLAELKSVNQSVNARIKQKLDSASTGKDDVWGLPSNAGDCEDFAILKKHELMKRGWPSSALLLTVVTYMGQGHVLLTVRTEQGDMVLDNRTNSVKDWSRTPYRFFARQSQSKYGKWDRIGTARTS
jgi:predicted transglutaminase-like cysteine proteinase